MKTSQLLSIESNDFFNNYIYFTHLQTRVRIPPCSELPNVLLKIENCVLLLLLMKNY